MYQASGAFHYAVEHGAHQIALMIFNDAVFTNANIDVVSGIEFNERYCYRSGNVKRIKVQGFQ